MVYVRIDMKQHKWHKEIKAWADGAEIEYRYVGSATTTYINYINWKTTNDFRWDDPSWEYRIKPQPKKILDEIGEAEIKQMLDDIEYYQKRVEELEKIHKEPQYLYVYLDDNYELSTIPLDNDRWKYIGKIKLEEIG